MFNHARTLLLNDIGRNSPGYPFPGEEGVPQDYFPFGESAAIKAVRAALFGTSPDRLMMNYRLRQFMPLLHATELEDYLLDLDDRVTYMPVVEDLYDEATFQNTVQGSNKPFYFVGKFMPDDVLGRLQQEWRVSVGQSGQATVFGETPPISQNTHSFTTANGVSSVVPLGRGLSCYFDPTPGNTWHAMARARPGRDLPQIVEAVRNSVGEARMTQLFGSAPAEPYKTFKALWYDHPFLPYQLGGLLMALVYRSHEAWIKET